MSEPIRILSVVPTSCAGYACFDGTMLVDWGARRVKSVKGKHRDAIHAERITRLVDVLHPDAVLLPSSKAGVASELERTLQRHGVGGVRFVTERDVTRCFAKLVHPHRPNHHRVMLLMAEFYPELKRCLPRRERRIYEGPDYWTSMFDAVAQAFAWMQKSC